MMENVNSQFAGKIILTALESGSLKLIGPHAPLQTALRNAEADAAYLLKLITQLTTQAQPPEPPAG